MLGPQAGVRAHLKQVLQLLKGKKYDSRAGIEYEYRGEEAVVGVRKCFHHCWMVRRIKAASPLCNPSLLRNQTNGGEAMRQDRTTRRNFVAGTAGAAFGAMIAPWHVLGGPGYQAPSDKLNIREIAAAIASDYRVPETLNWELFLGPAPEVPYHPMYHPFNWRGWLDWGTGAVGDMAAHLIDHPYWVLGLTYPTGIEATSTPFGTDSENKPVTFPLATRITYQFPARGARPPVRLTWYDGGLMPSRPEVLSENVLLQRGGGVIMVGEK